MSRRISAALAALVLCLVGIAPADADSTITIRGLSSGPTPTNPYMYPWSCSGGPVQSGSVKLTATDSNPAPTLGDASWGFQVQFGGGNEFGPMVDVGSGADLATFQVKVYGPSTGQAVVFAAPPDTPGNVWAGTADLTAASGWTTVSVPTTTTYHWQQYDGSTGTAVGTPESRTLAAFDTAHGASPGYSAGLLFGCTLGAGQSYYFDAFAWGASGQVTTYNFDKFTSSATAARVPATITAGGAATISGKSRSSSMELQQRRYGSSVWQDVKAVTGGAADPNTGLRSYTATVKPLTQTSYRWSIAGSSCCLAGHSATVTVGVRTAVTLKLADSTIRKGQALVASGITKPHKAGVAVTLWRKTATGASLLASSKVHSDGTYKLSYRVPSKGTWKVFVKVAAASGNLAGQSVVRSATVS